MQFHRSIGKCLPLFMDISTLENETPGVSKRRIPTIPEWRRPLVRCWDIPHIARNNMLKNSTGIECNTFFL